VSGDGLVVAGWILEEPLGSGGFGEVWKARRRHLDHRRALKLMRIVSETVFESWRHEIARLDALSHPGIVRFYDADIVAEGPYRNHAWIATELCERSLADELLRRPTPVLTEGECERLLDEVLAALSAARAGGCVHRDVKPANILLHSSGAWKLADFGTARLVPPGASHPETRVIGTLPYMSPDAHRGRQDHAADLYALAVTVHESRWGRRLHPRPPDMTDSEYVRLLLDTPPVIDPTLPRRWQTVVEALIGRHGGLDAIQLAKWFHETRGNQPPSPAGSAGSAGRSGDEPTNTTPTEPASPAAAQAPPDTSTTIARHPYGRRGTPATRALLIATAVAVAAVVVLAFLHRGEGRDSAAGRGTETSTTADEAEPDADATGTTRDATTTSTEARTQPTADVVGRVPPDPDSPIATIWPTDALVSKTLIEGDGRTAIAGDTLTVHYVGELVDGAVFDQSWGGEPFVFTLGEGTVIAGWEQGLHGATVGERRRLVIGSDLAYGDQGIADGAIPPYAVLVFEIDVLDIEPGR
jgi:FKBP-type peptidyl-prolyl cis-trans isomerase